MKNLIKLLAYLCLGFIFCGQSVHAETKRAFLIGISDYGNANEDSNKWANISGANDITLLAPLFQEQGFTVESLVDSKATHAGITKALDKLENSCKKGDIVYVHFSMHGQPFEDLNGDEEDGWDEALIPVDAEMLYAEGVYEGKNHLLDDELEVYFNDIRSKLGSEGQLFIALDIDNGSQGFTRKELGPAKQSKNYFQFSRESGLSPITVIASCLPFQSSREVRDVDTDTWYGSLSYYIAQAMKEQQICSSKDWIETVKTGMSKDRRLRKQTVVIEKTE